MKTGLKVGHRSAQELVGVCKALPLEADAAVGT